MSGQQLSNSVVIFKIYQICLEIILEILPNYAFRHTDTVQNGSRNLYTLRILNLMGLYDNSTDNLDSPGPAGAIETFTLETPRVSPFVYESELVHFTNWLKSFQPGFADLPEVEIEVKSRESFEHFLGHGSLPPLLIESENPIRLVYRGRSLQAMATPKPNVMLWVRKLQSQLIQDCLFKTANDADTVIQDLEVQLNRLVAKEYIDDCTKIYLSHAIKIRFKMVIGMFHLIYNLFIHTLEACLVKLRFDTASVDHLLSLVRLIFMRRGYSYMAIFSNEQLVNELISSLQPEISQCSIEVIENISVCIQRAAKLVTLLDVSKVVLSDFLRHPRWGDGCLASQVSTIFDNQHEGVSYDNDIASRIRLASLDCMAQQDLIELYLRLLVPKTSKSYYFALKETAKYIIEPDSLQITTSRRVRCKCTYKDVSYEERVGSSSIFFTLRPSDV